MSGQGLHKSSIRNPEGLHAAVPSASVSSVWSLENLELCQEELVIQLVFLLRSFSLAYPVSAQHG